LSSARALPQMTSLIERAGEADALVVYVNDNHGNWNAGRHALSEWALDGADRALVEPIVPDPRDFKLLGKVVEVRRYL